MANEVEFNRRSFLRVLGAGSAMATLVGCGSEPPEKLIPYLIPPENIVPGTDVWYATSCHECPAGCGMVLKTRDGRAIKAEGNPSHPVNGGALCARGQAALQGLYNPDRIREPLRRVDDGSFKAISWEDAESIVAVEIQRLRRDGHGDRVAFLTSLVGPTLRELIDRFLGALGSHRRFTFEPLSYEGLRQASEILFGLGTIPRYDLAKSKMIVSFGADFLETWVSPVEHARGFGSMRAYRDGAMGRFVYVGPRLSLTGANADEWVSTRPGHEGLLAYGMVHHIVAEELGVALSKQEREILTAHVRDYSPRRVSERIGIPEKKIVHLAQVFTAVRPSVALGGGSDLSSSNGKATSIAVMLLNYVAGNIGNTVEFRSYSAMDGIAGRSDLDALRNEMRRGGLSLLFFHGANPVFSEPGESALRDALRQVPLKVAFSEFLDETTAEADLVLPTNDPLESWGDYSPREGVYNLTQPVMRPLFRTRSVGDALLSLARRIDEKIAAELSWPSFYDYLRESWRGLQKEFGAKESFESFWQQALSRGGVWKEVRGEKVRLRPESLKNITPGGSHDDDSGQEMSLWLYPSIAHFDGRGANRPWLQELPDPMTHITWGNWVEIHPQSAEKLGIAEGSIVKISSSHGAVEAPAHLYEGIRTDTVALPIGQGHSDFGRYARGQGKNPVSLLSALGDEKPVNATEAAYAVRLEVVPAHSRLASTAGSIRQEERGIAQAVTVSELSRLFLNGPPAPKEKPQFRDPHPHPDHRWGMVVDLNACIGCSACMVACSAENNVPTVGKEKVLSGREMFWIRIEHYAETKKGQIDDRFVPMMCQQCDQAPCEPVCPVYATYHRPDGLNAQIYNRCVGTRYCSNNCPYKVRRFNWFEYEWPEPLNLQLNPDVSVRSKGIMEKCTFCFQRIRAAKDRVKDEGRPLRDGDITPACVQTCPTSALIFGDLKDLSSRVYKSAHDPRRYRILEELNTEPAITYLKKIRREDEV